jgi:hypothetical protein
LYYHTSYKNKDSERRAAPNIIKRSGLNPRTFFCISADIRHLPYRSKYANRDFSKRCNRQTDGKLAHFPTLSAMPDVLKSSESIALFSTLSAMLDLLKLSAAFPNDVTDKPTEEPRLPQRPTFSNFS